MLSYRSILTKFFYYNYTTTTTSTTKCCKIINPDYAHTESPVKQDMQSCKPQVWYWHYLAHEIIIYYGIFLFSSSNIQDIG